MNPRRFAYRWTARKKREVLDLIARRRITEQEALERYDLTAAELAEWRSNFERSGLPGLKALSIRGQTCKP